MLTHVRNAVRNVDIFCRHLKTNRVYCDIDNTDPNCNIDPYAVADLEGGGPGDPPPPLSKGEKKIGSVV